MSNITKYIVLGAKTNTIYHHGPSRADCMKWITELATRKFDRRDYDRVDNLNLSEPMYVCQSNKSKPKFEPVKSQHVVDDDEIVKLHNNGQSAREISLKLGLSEVTVEEHLKKYF